LLYASPELLNEEVPSEASEAWSLGVILFVMVYGVWPFNGNNP
jgi:hypothetical protein